MTNDKDKKTLVISTAAILLLIMVVVGATYAYFQAQGDSGVSTPTTIQTATTDSLVFEVGKDLNITADMSNFAEGVGNRSDSTFAKATLKANNKTNSATNQYNLFLIIEENELKHTTEDNKAELLLKITRPDDTEVLSIDGLSYKTVTDGEGNEQSGFDLTGRTGGFEIAGDYLIESTGEEIQNWNIEVILVNLDSDQTANTGKSFSGKILITKEDYESYKLININTVNATKTSSKITTTLKLENGTTDIDKYYFAIEEVGATTVASPVARRMSRLANIPDEKLEYFESDTPTYTFNNLKYETTYKIYSYAKDKLGYKSNVYETEITTDNYVPPKITRVEVLTTTFNSVRVRVTTQKGSNNITKYHYTKDNEEYSANGQTTNDYTYTNLEDSTSYTLKIKVSDDEGKFSNEYTTKVTTPRVELSTYLIDGYNKYKIKNLYYHTSSLANSAGDNSYRFSGPYESVNNYVCFGMNGDTCDNAHLYRIIGVFNNQVKLILADYADYSHIGDYRNSYATKNYTDYKGNLSTYREYVWNGDHSIYASSGAKNTWYSSKLNTNRLNSIFLNNIGTTWSNKIATTNWKVGGNTYANIAETNAKTAFRYEITSPVSGQIAVNKKVGLMYVSDYMYAASSKYWTYKGNDTNDTKDYKAAINNNWLYNGIGEMTITRISDSETEFFLISYGSYGGKIRKNTVYNGGAARPVFYLNSNVKKIGGTGTPTDPYLIS